jgi:hypothetical protein
MWLLTGENDGSTAINLAHFTGLKVHQSVEGDWRVSAYISEGNLVFISAWDTQEKARSVMSKILAAMEGKSYRDFQP